MLLDIRATQLERLLAQGYDYLKQKQQQQALLCFNGMVLLAPKHIEALSQCAEILINLNRPAEATVYAQHAIQLHPSPPILTIYGKALYQMGKYFEALDCFERIIAEEPNNYIAIGQRALCLTKVNRYDEALSVLTQFDGHFSTINDGYYMHKKCTESLLRPVLNQPKN